MSAPASKCRATGPVRFFASVLALAMAVGGAVALTLAAPAHACACGAFAPLPDSLVTLDSESAIVSWVDGQEVIDMRLALDSLTTQTGLIVPTPTPATVRLGAMSDFTTLTVEMTPQRISKDEWWRASPAANGLAGSAPQGGGAAPTVLDRVQLGGVEGAILAADDADGLTAWLAGNGYGVAEAVSQRLGHYVDKGWAFVALRVNSDRPLDGDLEPLHFEFASDEFVYPLFLSQAAASPQMVNLYILADHRQTVAFADGGSVGAMVNWARFVQNINMQKRGMYLTAVSMHFTDPAATISDDLVITRAATDDEVGTVIVIHNYMTVLGVPLGWLLLGFGAVITGLVLALTISPRRWG